MKNCFAFTLLLWLLTANLGWAQNWWDCPPFQTRLLSVDAHCVTLEWDATSAYSIYEVHYWKNPTAARPYPHDFQKTLFTLNTSIIITGLSNNTEYSFFVEVIIKDRQMDVYCSGTDTIITTTLTTQVDPNCYPLGPYIIETPIYIYQQLQPSATVVLPTLQPACQVPALKPEFPILNAAALVEWNSISGATSYDIGIRERGNASATWQEQNINQASFHFANLNSTMGYDLRVRTRCGAALSNYANALLLPQANAPDCPTPEPSLVSVSSNGASFDWPTVPQALSYSFRYKRKINGLWLVSTTAVPSANLTGLQPNTRYEAQARSVCDDGPGLWSASVEFQTTSSSRSGAVSVVNATDGLLLYPNPTTGAVSFRWESAPETDWQLRAFTANGQLVRQQKLSSSEGAAQTDLQDLPAGLYLLELRSGTMTARVPVVLQ